MIIFIFFILFSRTSTAHHPTRNTLKLAQALPRIPTGIYVRYLTQLKRSLKIHILRGSNQRIGKHMSNCGSSSFVRNLHDPENPFSLLQSEAWSLATMRDRQDSFQGRFTISRIFMIIDVVYDVF